MRRERIGKKGEAIFLEGDAILGAVQGEEELKTLVRRCQESKGGESSQGKPRQLEKVRVM